MADDFFRMAVPEIGIAIEQNTENVPKDGKYHVLKDGQVVASYPSLKRARDMFQQLKEKAGYRPPAVAGAAGDPDGVANKEHIERVLDAAGRYWGSSHKFRGKGGRGGRGGV